MAQMGSWLSRCLHTRSRPDYETCGGELGFTEWLFLGDIRFVGSGNAFSMRSEALVGFGLYHDYPYIGNGGLD